MPRRLPTLAAFRPDSTFQKLRYFFSLDQWLNTQAHVQEAVDAIPIDTYVLLCLTKTKNKNRKVLNILDWGKRSAQFTKLKLQAL